MTDRNVKVDVKADVSNFNRNMLAATAAAKAFSAATNTSVRNFTREIDKSNDRTVWLAQSITGLGPALVPLGGAGITAIAGLTTQLTVAGMAAGVTALAFNGIGDALGALNDYQIDPTEARLAKLNETMAKVGPEGREFVEFLDSLGPALSGLSNASRAAMLPGFTDGLRAMMAELPRFQRIVTEIAEGVGELARSSGEGLAGEGFDRFFDYIESDAKPILLDMGRTMGQFIQGTADLLVSFGPLTRDFSKGFANMASSYAKWAAGTGDSSSFQNFLDYLAETGPKVLDLLGQLAVTIAALAKAAAPVGDALLPALSGFLNVIEGIANTPLGPIVIGLASLVGVIGRLSALGTLVGGGAIGGLFAGMSGGAVAAAKNAKMLKPSMREMGTAMLYAAHSQDTLKKSMNSGSVIAAKSAKHALLAKTQVAGFAKAAAPAAGAAALFGLSMSGASDSMGLVNTTSLAMAGMLIGPWGAAVGGSVGLLMDMASANRNAAAAEQQTTDAIKSGSAERIAARLAELQAERKSQKESALAGFRDTFSFMGPDKGYSKSDQTAAGIDRLNAAQEKARVAAANAKSALTSVYGQDVANVATMSVKEFGATVESVNAILSGRASMRDYEAALDAVAESISKNGRNLRITTAAGRDNQAALDAIASTALRVASSMSEIDRGRYLVRARRDFVDAAVKMGMPRAAARRLAGELLSLDKIHARPKVSLEAQAALALARQVQDAVRNIRDRNVRIHTSYTQSGGAGRQMGGVPQAAGGFVPKTGLPYADRHPYLLADGEGVTTNRRGETDRFRDVITGINAGLSRAQIKGMLADGGIIGLAKGGFTKAEYRSTSRNFDLKAGQSAAEAARELRTFSREVKKAGGHVGKNFGALSKRAVNVARSLEANSKALDTWRSKQADARSGAASAFNNDAFKGSLADMKLQLEADRNDSSRLASLTANLRGKGIKNDFLASLTSSGNLGLAQELASASKSQVLSYQSLFGQRASAQGSAGAQAAAGYNVVVGQLNGLVKRQTAVLNKLETGVERGAARGVSKDAKKSKAKGKSK